MAVSRWLNCFRKPCVFGIWCSRPTRSGRIPARCRADGLLYWRRFSLADRQYAAACGIHYPIGPLFFQFDGAENSVQVTHGVAGRGTKTPPDMASELGSWLGPSRSTLCVRWADPMKKWCRAGHGNLFMLFFPSLISDLGGCRRAMVAKFCLISMPGNIGPMTGGWCCRVFMGL